MPRSFFLALIVVLTLVLGGAKFLLGEMRHGLMVSIEDMTARKQGAMIQVTEAEAAYSKRLAVISTDASYREGFIEEKQPIFVRSTVETAFISR